MGSEFPRSPACPQGWPCRLPFADLFPTVIVFQYNPDEVSARCKCNRRARHRFAVSQWVNGHRRKPDLLSRDRRGRSIWKARRKSDDGREWTAIPFIASIEALV